MEKLFKMSIPRPKEEKEEKCSGCNKMKKDPCTTVAQAKKCKSFIGKKTKLNASTDKSS